MKSSPVVVSDEVRAAVAQARAVVALESTIFTHGLSRPRNLQVALEAERALRDSGVVPATIGVVDRTPAVGLSPAHIGWLPRTDGAVKVSLPALPVTMAKGRSGGTTVSATA